MMVCFFLKFSIPLLALSPHLFLFLSILMSVRSSVCSSVCCPFVPLFVCSLLSLFNRLLVHPSVPSFVCSFVHLLVSSFLHLFVCLLVHLFIHLQGVSLSIIEHFNEYLSSTVKELKANGGCEVLAGLGSCHGHYH